MTDGSDAGPPVGGRGRGRAGSDALSWDLVVPVKRLDEAKSRLDGVDSACRRRLALSFALDAVDAALAATRVGRVLVVTADPLAAAELGLRGAVIVDETHGPGLNPAIEAGVAAVRQQDPLRRVAAMTGDLPAASGAEIDRVLAEAEGHSRAVLADAEGTGTVLLTANPVAGKEAPCPVRLRPLFGEGSFVRHLRAGHVALTGDHPGLRRDVDTCADLEAARRLGVGGMTEEALNGLVSV